MICGAWRQVAVPHKGWSCWKVEDLGELAGECEFCGTEIRYEHWMEHPEVARSYVAGCVCAGYLEDNYAAPRERERLLKNRAARRARWPKRRWKRSKAGNYRIAVGGTTVGVFQDPYSPGHWRARIGERFGTLQYLTAEAAMLGLFDRLYPTRSIVAAESYSHG